MADIAIQLPVFISSADDAKLERTIAEEIVSELASEALQRGVVLSSFSWRLDAYPAAGPPKERLYSRLERSELVTVIFRDRMGEGTREELYDALQNIEGGLTDQIFVYFWSKGNCLDFQRELEESHTLLARGYESPEDFGGQLRKHMRLWLERWANVPRICEWTLNHAAPRMSEGSPAPSESDFHRARQILPPDDKRTKQLGLLTTAVYQMHGPSGVEKPIDRRSLDQFPGWKSLASSEEGIDNIFKLFELIHRMPDKPFCIKDRDQVYFASASWYYYLCAVGLVQSIQRERVEAISEIPYINPVHQYLSLLAPDSVVPHLRAWLLNSNGQWDGMPVVRNFAAYVLGMLEAKEAEQDLIQALKTDQDPDVQMYCVTSLGKLRCRRAMETLVEAYDKAPENGSHFKLTVGQALCRIVGIAEYEL